MTIVSEAIEIDSRPACTLVTGVGEFGAPGDDLPISQREILPDGTPPLIERLIVRALVKS
jgi:hypothetical protein